MPKNSFAISEKRWKWTYYQIAPRCLLKCWNDCLSGKEKALSLIGHRLVFISCTIWPHNSGSLTFRCHLSIRFHFACKHRYLRFQCEIVSDYRIELGTTAAVLFWRTVRTLDALIFQTSNAFEGYRGCTRNAVVLQHCRMSPTTFLFTQILAVIVCKVGWNNKSPFIVKYYMYNLRSRPANVETFLS